MHKTSLITVLVVSLSGGFAEAQQSYSFTRLQAPFAGVDQTIASGINDLGWVAGNYHDAQGPHGFLLRHGKYTSFDVPFPGAKDTVALGINQFGHIVGRYDTAKVSGFLLKDGEYTSIDAPFPNVNGTIAYGINVFGQIVGIVCDDSGDTHGFLYAHGEFTQIDVPFPGAQSTQALGINDRGVIVGGYVAADVGQVRGFVLENGQYSSLAEPGAAETLACGINNLGKVVGTSFALNRGKYTHFTASLPGLDIVFATPLGINDLGWLTGLAADANGQEYGFVARPQYEH